jgi:hypothetical protein
MKHKNLYNILFFIICLIFTIGYSLYPIINIKNNSINSYCYINKVVIDTPIGSFIKYYNDLNIDNKYKILLQYMYVSCIIVSCLIICGIVSSYLFIPLISKIIFALVQLFILSYSGILLYLYYSKFIQNTIPSSENITLVKSYGLGGFLFHISTVLIIINRLVFL